MEAKELKEIALIAKAEQADQFWKEYSEKTLFPFLKKMAEGGSYAVKITKNNEELNLYGWLTVPNLYRKVIFKLNNLGYAIKHSDDLKDGPYIFIRWGEEEE